MLERLLVLRAHAKADLVGRALVMGLTVALVWASMSAGVAAVTLTQASPTAASVTSSHGAATNLTCAFSRVTIANDGASTSTATVTIRDANAHRVEEGSYSITFSKASGTSTTVETASPRTTNDGKTTFTVRSTTTAGTDTYTAAITPATTPTLANPTSPACSVSAQTVAPPADAAACAEALRSLDASFQRYRAALHERNNDKRARDTLKQAEELLKGIRKVARGALRAIGCRADDDESALDLHLSGSDPRSIALEADLAMRLVVDWARLALCLPALQPGRTESGLTPAPRLCLDPTTPPDDSEDSDGTEHSDGSEDSD